MNPYYEQKILNSEPVELIRLVYRRAIECVREARERLREKKIAERSAAIVRAYGAIAQLIAALDPEAAPELCDRLRNLYSYMQQRLLDANFQQSDQPLVEVLRLLTTLAGAWSEVAERLAANDVAKAEGARRYLESWRSGAIHAELRHAGVIRSCLSQPVPTAPRRFFERARKR